MNLSKLLNDLLLFVGGFVSGIITAFGKGWVDEIFKKREETRKEVEKFMGKVTDLVAIATSEGYVIRLNMVDKRRMQRAAFQLERLGKTRLASNIRNYMNKWDGVYKMTSGVTFKDGSLPILEEEKRRLELIKELDGLTNSILKG